MFLETKVGAPFLAEGLNLKTVIAILNIPLLQYLQKLSVFILIRLKLAFILLSPFEIRKGLGRERPRNSRHQFTKDSLFEMLSSRWDHNSPEGFGNL